MNNEIVSLEGLATWWGITVENVEALIKQGLPCIEVVKGKYIFLRSELIEFIRQEHNLNEVKKVKLANPKR